MQKITVNGIEHLWELGRLAKARGRDVMALCPAHNDTNPSLAINLGEDGRLLLDCKSLCPTENICSVLGVTMKDLFMDNHNGSKSDIVFDYKNAEGKLVYQVCRFPNKKFVQRRPGNNGEFVWNLKDVKRLLYRLPELNAANKRRYVFVPEGEKDVDRLTGLGMVATCNSGGAGNWMPEISEPLRDRRIILIADHDAPGRKHTGEVAKLLTGIASEIKIIEFENPKEGFDVTDFLNNGGTKEQIKELVSKTKPLIHKDQLQRRILADVAPEKIEWLQPEIIPLGMLTSIISQEGIGKSCLASDIAARVTQGKPWPNAPDVSNPKGYVIIFNHEESVSKVLVPRLIADGADTSRIIEAQNVVTVNGQSHEFDIEKDVAELKNLISEYPETRLVIFDPITSYCTCNENSNAEVRRALKALVDLAKNKNIAVLALTHLNKKIDLGMINRTIGSRAWSAVPRMAWGIVAEQLEDEDGIKTDTDKRFLLNIKTNCGVKPKGLKFCIGDCGKVTWDEERTDMSIDQNYKIKASRVEETAEWLKELLGSKSMTSAFIFEEGEKQGFSRTLLYRAKDKLEIKASKIGWGNEGQWFWELPDNEDTQA